MGGQKGTSVEGFEFMPPTVVEHTQHDDGMTLHTLDPDPDMDIEIYDDDRKPHRSGNPPEN